MRNSKAMAVVMVSVLGLILCSSLWYIVAGPQEETAGERIVSGIGQYFYDEYVIGDYVHAELVNARSAVEEEERRVHLINALSEMDGGRIGTQAVTVPAPDYLSRYIKERNDTWRRIADALKGELTEGERLSDDDLVHLMTLTNVLRTQAEQISGISNRTWEEIEKSELEYDFNHMILNLRTT